MTIDAQIADMASLWPEFRLTARDGPIASWEGPVRPLLQTFAVDIIYRAPLIIEQLDVRILQPRVRVLSPPLRRRPGDPLGTLPHVYYTPDGDVRLCMLDPDADDWSPFDSLAHTSLGSSNGSRLTKDGAPRANGRRAAATLSREAPVSKSSIPQKIQSALWARAAGRCQYRGCNADLVGDLVADRQDGIFGFIAHIVADIEGGPRGDPVRSPRLARSLENLMLMCARHHKLIDLDAVADHPEPVLLAMKAEHEARIAVVAGIDADRASHVIRFGATICDNEALVSTQAIFSAMPPERHPASNQTLDLEMVGCAFRDSEPAYWAIQRENLRRQFEAKVRGRVERQEIRHLSVFALAPQPLLIELGRLLCDIVPATVHQRHREPASWRWADDGPPIAIRVTEPDHQLSGPVALKLGFSATVTDARLQTVLGSHAAIWSLCADLPHNDVLRRADDQAAFRKELRRLYDRIKARHGDGTLLHVFPALPASLAVEVGRVWMPKSDLPLRLYDNNRSHGFISTFDVD